MDAYQQSSGHQVFVWIGNTTGADPIEDWGVRAFKAWRVGRKNIDDGLVLFVMSEDKTARIEVGYGLEGQVPDAIASRIINESIIPLMKSGDHDGAVTAGVDKLIAAIGGQGAPNPPPVPIPFWEEILLGIGAVVLIILGIRYPLVGYYLIYMLSAATGGSSSGGASGGGGRSGGGGASGKW